MSKEIKELQRIRSILSYVTGFEDDDQENIEDARKSVGRVIDSLAKPDFWEGYVPEPVKPAQDALDKKAENARELGLDYEPIQQEPVALFKWLPCDCCWPEDSRSIAEDFADVIRDRGNT